MDKTLKYILTFIPLIIMALFVASYSEFLSYFLLFLLFFLALMRVFYPLLKEMKEPETEMKKENMEYKGEYEYFTDKVKQALKGGAASQRYVANKVLDMAIDDIANSMGMTKDRILENVEKREIYNMIDKEYADLLMDLFTHRFNDMASEDVKKFEIKMSLILNKIEKFGVE